MNRLLPSPSYQVCIDCLFDPLSRSLFAYNHSETRPKHGTLVFMLVHLGSRCSLLGVYVLLVISECVCVCVRVRVCVMYMFCHVCCVYVHVWCVCVHVVCVCTCGVTECVVQKVLVFCVGV